MQLLVELIKFAIYMVFGILIAVFWLFAKILGGA